MSDGIISVVTLGVILLAVATVIHGALGSTVYSSTEKATATGGALENASAGSKAGFNLTLLVYSFLMVIAGAGVMMGFIKVGAAK
jgi:hypothetical protein